MSKFVDELRNTPVNKPEKKTTLIDSILLERKADALLKDYISDEMRKDAESVICSFKDACIEIAKIGKRHIDWSSGNIVFITRGTMFHTLSGSDHYSRQKAQKIKMLVETELAEMGLQSYHVSINKRDTGGRYGRNYYFYFKIHAKW